MGNFFNSLKIKKIEIKYLRQKLCYDKPTFSNIINTIILHLILSLSHSIGETPISTVIVSRISRLITQEHLEVNRWSQFLSLTERFPGSMMQRCEAWNLGFLEEESSACCMYKNRFLSINMDRYREFCAEPNSPLSDRPIIQYGEHHPAARLAVLLWLAIATHFSLSRAKAHVAGMKVELWRKRAFLSALQLPIHEQGNLVDFLDDRRWWPRTIHELSAGVN